MADPFSRLPYQTPPSYNTQLSPLHEMAFRQWLQSNKVPFDVAAPATDYDIRGFWQAMQQGNPMARSAVNPNDQQMHYPDFWKTPLHQSFSNESQWAGLGAPRWINDSQLASPSGRIVFDERAAPRPFFPHGR
jgi:hypothetical protein